MEVILTLALAQIPEFSPALAERLAGAARRQYAFRWPLAGVVVHGASGMHRVVLVGRQ